MASYEFLAGCYDELTTDVGYVQRGPTIWERHFARAKIPVHTVLGLACGTGSLTWELARRGYEMIGVDRSEEMLAQANEKGAGLDVAERPIFLHQSMDRLDYLRHHRRLCLLPGQRELCHPACCTGEGLPAGPPLSHARRSVYLRCEYTRKSCAVWTGRYFWTRQRIPTVYGGRNMQNGGGSAPMPWISSVRRRVVSGSGERSCTRSMPTNSTSWRKCSAGRDSAPSGDMESGSCAPPGMGNSAYFSRHERNYST